MLSLFPQLLFLSALAPTLLRVAAGVYLLLLAYRTASARERFASLQYPIIGNPPTWLITCAAILLAGISISLVVGFWTQAAALLGALSALKLLILPQRMLSPIATYTQRSTMMLLLALCLSLVITGAGAFAFDLPL